MCLLLLHVYGGVDGAGDVVFHATHAVLEINITCPWKVLASNLNQISSMMCSNSHLDTSGGSQCSPLPRFHP